MLESIILGVTQGITEWLPISSEGAVTFLEVTVFKTLGNLTNIIQFSLFLHLGTVLAATAYFWRDIKKLLWEVFYFKKGHEETKVLLRFLIITTVVSGAIGLALLKLLSSFEYELFIAGRGITFILGILLLVTGGMQMVVRKKERLRKVRALGLTDGVLAGIAQGFAVLPGLSRSGLTVSALLLRDINDREALELSILMSIPIVIAGNIFLNFEMFALTVNTFIALLFSFVIGLVTIHALLKLADRVRFGPFAIFFGLLVLLSAFFV